MAERKGGAVDLDEDHLAPLMGRLIDTAKQALVHAPVAVALLDEEGRIRVGSAAAALEAAAAALKAGQERRTRVVAAAFAQANAAATAVPDDACLSLFAEIDAELPLVHKQRGRWVVLSVSRLQQGLAGRSSGPMTTRPGENNALSPRE